MPPPATRFDDRGRVVKLLDWRDLDVSNEREAELRRLIESQFTEPAAGRPARITGTACVLIRMASVLAASFGVYFALGQMGVPQSAIWIPVALTAILASLIPIPSAWLINVLLGRLAVRDQTDQLIAWSLIRNLCPSCGYNLERLEVAAESDECTVCPECGAAWKAGRIGRSRSTRPEPFRPS